jgi:hypothetical protein
MSRHLSKIVQRDPNKENRRKKKGETYIYIWKIWFIVFVFLRFDAYVLFLFVFVYFLVWESCLRNFEASRGEFRPRSPLR